MRHAGAVLTRAREPNGSHSVDHRPTNRQPPPTDNRKPKTDDGLDGYVLRRRPTTVHAAAAKASQTTTSPVRL
jgi:hypothetical protein